MRQCLRCERKNVMRGRPANHVLCSWCWEAWAAHRDCHNCRHGIKTTEPETGRNCLDEFFLCGLWKALYCQPGKASALWEPGGGQ
jgi:hypothetical protein